MIVLDLISSEGIVAGAANVDEGFAASSFGFIQAVARSAGFEVSQGYADTDHPSMNVYSGTDWTNFVRLTPDPGSPDSATRSAFASAPWPLSNSILSSTLSSTCSSSFYLQVGHTSDGVPICVYWPGVAVPVGVMALARAVFGASWWWTVGLGVMALYLVPRVAEKLAAARRTA